MKLSSCPTESSKVEHSPAESEEERPPSIPTSPSTQRDLFLWDTSADITSPLHIESSVLDLLYFGEEGEQVNLPQL